MTMDTILNRRKLRTPEAARWLGIGKSTLEKMRLTGNSPVYYKCGKIVTYDVADLEAWLATHKRRSTSDRGDAL